MEDYKKRVLEDMKKDLSSLRYASEELKGDLDFMELVVCINGRALQYASAEPRNDGNIVLGAIWNYEDAILYAS
jgi:hypothetical protein